MTETERQSSNWSVSAVCTWSEASNRITSCDRTIFHHFIRDCWWQDLALLHASLYIYVCRWMVTIFCHSWTPSNRTKCPSFLTWLRPFNFALFSGVQVCTAGIFQPNKFFFPWFAAATNFVQRELPVDAKGRDGRLQAVYHCQLKWWKKVGACSILCCIDHTVCVADMQCAEQQTW